MYLLPVIVHLNIYGELISIGIKHILQHRYTIALHVYIHVGGLRKEHVRGAVILGEADVHERCATANGRSHNAAHPNLLVRRNG